MEIRRITTTDTGNGHMCRVQFDSGEEITVTPAVLLSYRHFQKECLRKIGLHYIHGSAEERGGRRAWQRWISFRMDTTGGQPATPEER